MASGGIGGKGGLYFNVINTHATSLIKAGGIVALVPAALLDLVSTVGGGPGEPFIPVQGNEVAAVPAPVGVAMMPIAAGDVGQICVVGAVMSLTDSSVAAGDAVEIDAATNDFRFITFSAGTKKGLALEDEHVWGIEVDFGASTDTVAMVMVNFLGDLAFGV